MDCLTRVLDSENPFSHELAEMTGFNIDAFSPVGHKVFKLKSLLAPSLVPSDSSRVHSGHGLRGRRPHYGASRAYLRGGLGGV